MPDYEIVNNSYKVVFKMVTFEVKHGGETKRVLLKKLPCEFFTYLINHEEHFQIKSDSLMLMRNYDAIPFIVLLNGPISLYKAISFNILRYSETITGKPKELNKNVMAKILKQYDLLDAYKKEYPKFKGFNQI